MANIVAPSLSVPDFNYEYHVVNVDTIGQNSSNVFTCFLNNPLKNVVQANLLAAHVHASSPNLNLIYVSVDELNTQFHQRASNVYMDQATLSGLSHSFGSIVSSNVIPVVYKNEYPISAQYVNPIKSIDRLTMKLYNQAGTLLVPDPAVSNNFFIFQFLCKKGNSPGF